IDAGVDDRNAYAASAAEPMRILHVQLAHISLQLRVRIVVLRACRSELVERLSNDDVFILLQALENLFARRIRRDAKDDAVDLKRLDRPFGYGGELVLSAELCDLRD